MGPLTRAVQGRDWGAAAALVSARFGVAVDAGWVGAEVEAVRRPERTWWDGSWFSWFKNRLAAAGLLPCGRDDRAAVWLGVPLHVFFVSLEETPEMLVRLRNEPVAAGPGPASPGIGRRGTVGPIDRVAARVASVK